ncbi:D-alanyl-D-alanine carboxypeptidase family protein [Halovulum sp. GXIMD14793]
MIRTVLAAAVVILTALPSFALDTRARAALVVDHDTGTVLLSKNAEMALPPASMSKLMTLFLVFEALQEGRLSLTETFRVSEKAWKMGGSKMFLKQGEQVSVQNLILGVIVQSGNDACVVLAEGLAGSEAEFADRMTRRARELGMDQSTFANATGWPHPDHRMSARDLVILATEIINRFPEYYSFFGETTFTWDGIQQENRNPLLGLDIGADGLKTGHTEEAGYGLVGSAVRDGRRVTFMLTGLSSAQERLLEAENLTNWAFREFYSKRLFEADTKIAAANVWLGEADTVDLVAANPVDTLLAFEDRDKLKVNVVYTGPLEAPIKAGSTVAELVISTPTLGETRVPLAAAADVAEGGFLKRVRASAGILTNKLVVAAGDLIN